MAGAEHVLTIDLGTSGPKVALFTLGGDHVAAAFVPVSLDLGPDGRAEQDPDEWWAGVVGATRRLVDAGHVPTDSIVAISVTSQWSGTVAVDAAGRHLAPALTWMDSRGAPHVDARVGGRVRVAGYDPRRLRTWIRLTGGVPARSGQDPLGHILWIEAERPEIAAATALYLEPKDWLNLRLTGRARATVDSIALHWVTDNRDPHRIDYSPELLRLSGLDRRQLPDLVAATDVLGPVLPAVADELGVPEAAVVVGGTPDVQSATVGSGAVRDFEGHLYLGTSSWLSCHVPWKRTDVRHGVASLPAALPGRYFVADEQESAGACLTWLRDRVLWPGDALGGGPAPDDAFARIDRVAESAPAGSGGVLFTPWLNGERTPVDDHTIRAGWHNQSLRTSRAHLVRAVLEGVAFNSRWLLGCVERFTRRPFPALHAVGGGATSPTWCRIMADVLDRPVRMVEHPFHANTRGAALLAGVALGRLDARDLGARVRVVETFTPDPATRQVYDPMYREFRHLYRRTRGIHARLNA